MFTILVRHKDGNETVLENMKNPRRIVSPPVMIEGDRQLTERGFYAEYTAPNGPSAYYPQDGSGDLIFVMNDMGQTIAKYQL